MARYQSHKQTFIIAALIIFLCLVCLTGATLALFTSNQEDGTIGIVTTTGYLKVDIVDADNPAQSLVGEHLVFQSDDPEGLVWFEPGKTFSTQGFKIENEGNIPIKFRLYVSEDGDARTKEFQDAFEVWISTDPLDPNAAIDPAKFFDELGPESISNNTYFLLVKMKESAGNYYQNKPYSGIGVTVYAVQGNVEIERNTEQ